MSNHNIPVVCCPRLSMKVMSNIKISLILYQTVTLILWNKAKNWSKNKWSCFNPVFFDIPWITDEKTENWCCDVKDHLYSNHSVNFFVILSSVWHGMMSCLKWQMACVLAVVMRQFAVEARYLQTAAQLAKGHSRPACKSESGSTTLKWNSVKMAYYANVKPFLWSTRQYNKAF